MKHNITVDLELMVDKHGLLHVLTGLSLVCSEKADHLRHNWQDKTGAKVWDHDARMLDKAARDVRSDG